MRGQSFKTNKLKFQLFLHFCETCGGAHATIASPPPPPPSHRPCSCSKTIKGTRNVYIRVYMLYVLSEDINLFVRAFEKRSKASLWCVFFWPVSQRVNVFDFYGQFTHYVYILQCLKVKNNCQILLKRTQTNAV